jgi:hypothetical protein
MTGNAPELLDNLTFQAECELPHRGVAVIAGV